MLRNEAPDAESAAPARKAPSTASRYWLAKHAYLCVARGQVVILDLKRDKYLSVTAPEELAPWVEGWPVAPRSTDAAGSERAGAADRGIPASLLKLADAGVFTADPAGGKTAEVTMIPKPGSALVRFQFGIRPRVKLRHVMTIGRSWLAARAARRLPIQQLVEQVRERKARAAHRPCDLQQARDLVTAFLWLRPLYYGARDACLLDSLVLLELLAQEGLFPTWVFGVKVSPFGAHCWIQEGDVVWNDTPEHAGRYTPILCV